MAIIPKQSILEHSKIRPFSFALWCLLCEVKNKNFDDVFLDIKKAAEADIKKSAYYKGILELEKEGWIELSKIKDGKKYWRLIKGFSKPNSAFAENSANVENSAFVENVEPDFPQMRNPNSTNAENISTNAESPIRNTFFNESFNKKHSFTESECNVTRGEPPKPKSEKPHTHEKNNSLFENNFIKEFWKFFPNTTLSPSQMDTILERIRDGTSWKKALKYWSSNNYNGQRIGKICDRYDEEIQGINGESNGNGRINNPRESEWAKRTRESNELIEQLRRKADEARLLA